MGKGRRSAPEIVITNKNIGKKGLHVEKTSVCSTMDPSITAIVCSFRRPASLAGCLSSLDTQDCPGLRVMVVAVEADVETLRVVERSSADLVTQAQPEGISSARNQGVRAAKSPIVAFIDDDARARPGWAAGLLAAFTEDRIAGVGGPVVDSRTGGQVVRRWRVDPFGITHEATEDGNEWWCPILNGCNMAFKRTLLLSSGGFDSYYRYYFDETDLCVRLCRSGHGIAFTDHAVVDHDFAEGPTRREFLYFSSRMRAYFSFKNFHGLVPSGLLLYAQCSTLREDFRSFRRLPHKYPGILGACNAGKELAIGRLQGILDGMSANRHRTDMATFLQSGQLS